MPIAPRNVGASRGHAAEHKAGFTLLGAARSPEGKVAGFPGGQGRLCRWVLGSVDLAGLQIPTALGIESEVKYLEEPVCFP